MCVSLTTTLTSYRCLKHSGPGSGNTWMAVRKWHGKWLWEHLPTGLQDAWAVFWALLRGYKTEFLHSPNNKNVFKKFALGYKKMVWAPFLGISLYLQNTLNGIPNEMPQRKQKKKNHAHLRALNGFLIKPWQTCCASLKWTKRPVIWMELSNNVQYAEYTGRWLCWTEEGQRNHVIGMNYT